MPENRTHKASLSLSRLANPKSMAHRLALEFQEFIFLPDPIALYAVIGTVLANKLKGTPVWLMLIGPPSSGKTLLIDALISVPKIRGISSIKGTAALLSGTRKAEMAKGATGGILREIGSRGIMTFKDFTSVLSLEHKTREEIISAFREIYDGRWSRDVGVEGGRKLIWPSEKPTAEDPDKAKRKGRVGFVGACTKKIDNYTGVIGQLGERWLYYRYPPNDYYGETLKALGGVDDNKVALELAAIVESFLECIGAEWDMDRRDLSMTEKNRFLAMGSLMARVRSTPERDFRSREISSPPDPEAPQRMSKSLGQLYLGLELMGLSDGERWQTIERIAFDSAPAGKGAILQMLRVAGEVPVVQLAEMIRCGEKATRQMLDDLRAFDVVRLYENSQEGGRLEAVLSDTAKRYLSEGWKDLDV